MSLEANASATGSQNAPNINEIPDFGVAYAAAIQHIYDRFKEDPTGVWKLRIELEISSTDISTKMQLKPPEKEVMKSCLQTVALEDDGTTLRVALPS